MRRCFYSLKLVNTAPHAIPGRDPPDMNTDMPDPAASARGAALASNFTASLDVDQRMYREDIAGSIAHARMLARQGIISQTDAAQIVGGLQQIESEIESGEFVWKEELEDIHMNVESRLFELIGDAAGRLHTGRSRNDQVATDSRMYTKRAAADAVRAVRLTQRALLKQAADHVDTVLPGYTHLQRGQPVSLAHHLLAYFEMLDRDAGRFAAARDAADVLPLGSGAMAGVPYPLDRESVAAELGFSAISANSMDAVSDRDYMLDFVSASAVCMMHLSRLAEELIVWSTDEFGFASMGEAYTSGSSIMPQKRNPDYAELVRGKTGRVYGALVALLSTLKGLPLTYNRDLQEDKAPLFDAADTVLASLDATEGMVRTARFDAARMRRAMDESAALATDYADYLVAKGVPFRQAHIIVTDMTRMANDAGKRLCDLSLDELRSASSHFDKDALEITAESSIASRDVPGGAAPRRVREALQHAYGRVWRAHAAGEW